MVLVIDASGSIQTTDFNERIKTFVKKVIMDLDIESGYVRLGLMTFANSAREVFSLNRYRTRQEMVDAVDRMSHTRGDTYTDSALRYLHNNMYTRSRGDRERVKNVALLITDGASKEPERTLTEARAARKKGIHMLVAGVGNWLNQQEINGIATFPYSANTFKLRNFAGLDNSFADRIRRIACNSKLYVTACPPIVILGPTCVQSVC